MEESEKIVKFITDRKAFSIYDLEELAEIPHSTLSRVLSGERKLPKNHIEKLKKVLTKYGYK